MEKARQVAGLPVWIPKKIKNSSIMDNMLIITIKKNPPPFEIFILFYQKRRIVEVYYSFGIPICVPPSVEEFLRRIEAQIIIFKN